MDRRPFHENDGTHYDSEHLVQQRVRNFALNEQYLQSLNWIDPLSEGDGEQIRELLIRIDQNLHPYDGLYEEWEPTILSTMANAQDNPSWEEAMNGPDKKRYWEACKKEIKTLIKMDPWDVVKREDWMNIIPSTWAFKCKRFPNGSVRKLKARFCARGDRQIEGIDYFLTFAPVVNWQTVRIMLALSIVLGLLTKQVDYTAAL